MAAEWEVEGLGLEELVEGEVFWAMPLEFGVLETVEVLVENTNGGKVEAVTGSEDEGQVIESDTLERKGAGTDTEEGRPDERAREADESKGEAAGEFATIPKSALGVRVGVKEVVFGFLVLPGVNEG